MDDSNFVSILDHEFDLQTLLEALELLTGFGLSFHNAGGCPRLSRVETPLAHQGYEPTHPHVGAFCAAMKESPAGHEACKACDMKEGNALAGKLGRPVQRRCHAGLEEVLVPVKCEGRHVGTLFGGQARPPNLDAKGLAALRRHWLELELNPDRSESLLRQQTAAEPKRMRALASVLNALAETLATRAATHAIQQALQARKATPIQLALRFMAENIQRDFPLREVARQVHLSPSRLSHLFTRQYGRSFRETLLRLRLERAEQLLATTDLPVCEIAQRVGYADPDFFCRMFKKLRSLTPGQFRHQVRSV